MKNRVELCCHTKMSKLQGFNYAKEYIEEAINRGYKSIAITDVDSTQSFYEVYEYTKNTDFKIIYGSEMHFKNSQNSDKLYTIYVYVKEQDGLKNLYKLISKAYNNKIPTIISTIIFYIIIYFTIIINWLKIFITFFIKTF